MNKLLSLVVLIGVFAFGFGRDRNAKPKMSALLHWDGGHRIEDVVLRFNDRFLGRGEMGFNALLAEMEQLNQQTRMKVRYPAELWNPTLSGYSVWDPMPFWDRDDLRKKFSGMLANKHIRLTEEPY
jgi:hypothetical protein